MKKVSIITPTMNRPDLLSLAYKYFLSQKYQNLEWLILDDSDVPHPKFSDLKEGNISYFHSYRKMSIGEKRNILIDKAGGELILNFDDDDYYSPDYVSLMTSFLEGNNLDLVNLRGFFVFNGSTHTLGYWDLMLKSGLHFEVSKNGVRAWDIDDNDGKTAFEHNHLGYGFGWIFRKRVWDRHPYPNINWNEDGEFALKALENFKLGGISDQKGSCLHFIHHNSTSKCFPQYILPPLLVSNFFALEMIEDHLSASSSINKK